MPTQELRNPWQEDQPADRVGGADAERAGERLPGIGSAAGLPLEAARRSITLRAPR
jgi:hypothetical protein